MTARFGLRDYLSPSAIGAWDRCQMQFKIFRVEGAVAPPDAALAVKQLNHRVILEDDLSYKILTQHNRANSELSELYRAGMEQAVPIFKEDPNFTEPIEKFITEEAKYFDQVLTATEPFRRETIPLEVEHQVDFSFGGIPIQSRLDLISLSGNSNAATPPMSGGQKMIEDLKRQGQSPPEGSAAKSRQLVTYAAGTGISEVGLVAVVENKKPIVKRDSGTVTKGEVERVKAQYQGAAFQIDNALQSGVFAPVDHGDPRKNWICTAKFCGAYKIGSKDVKTGRDISCPYGQRSEVRA